MPRKTTGGGATDKYTIAGCLSGAFDDVQEEAEVDEREEVCREEA